MSESTSSPRPNVIWVFGDQHRAQALGYRGDPNVRTPNIDRLAMEGMSMNGAVGGCPLCCPFRGSLITSRYPHQAVPGHEYPLPEGMPTVATAFNDAGYDTAYFGKWHLAGWHERDGRGGKHVVPRKLRGEFKTWVGYENNNSQFDCYVHGHDASGNEVEQYRLPTYETDGLTDLTLDYIDQKAESGEPFFCALSVQPPHNPYVSPEDWQGRHSAGEIQLRPNVPNIPRVVERARMELAGYYGMIENLDWNLGRVRDRLRERGLLDHTHIIFFSDHGDMHGSQGQFLKTNPFEESVRVPCILGGLVPHYEGQSGQVEAPMNHVDYGPTSLGLCGLDVPEWMQGTDYSACRRWRGQVKDAPDSAYIQLPIPTGHGYSTDRAWRGVVTTDGWKYVCFEHTPWLMFNLNEDPYEQCNVAHNSVFGRQRHHLQDRLAQWIRETDDTFALPVL